MRSVLFVTLKSVSTSRGSQYEIGTRIECESTPGTGSGREQCVGGKATECISCIVDPRAFVASRCSCDARSAIALLPRAFLRRRSTNSAPDYPTDVLGGKYPITSIRDLTTGYDNTKPGNRAVLPVSKSSQMITFTFKNGLVTTIRSSGTEPKIKYYNELCASPDQKDLNELHRILKEMVSAIVEEFLQPEANKLIPRGS